MLFTFLVVLAYLLGSVCSAVIVCRLFNLPDPRLEGSKNPGATNVLRVAGKHYAALVLLADMLKGTLPVVIATLVHASPSSIGFTALAAVIGHVYPIFFKFKGGKGVATAIGAFLGIQFLVGIMVCATWLLVAKFFRYSSLASITAIIFAPFYTILLTGQVSLTPPLFLIVLLVLYQHRNNIARLIDGTEPRIKLKPNILGEVMSRPTPSAHEEPRSQEASSLKEKNAQNKDSPPT